MTEPKPEPIKCGKCFHLVGGDQCVKDDFPMKKCLAGMKSEENMDTCTTDCVTDPDYIKPEPIAPMEPEPIAPIKPEEPDFILPRKISCEKCHHQEGDVCVKNELPMIRCKAGMKSVEDPENCSMKCVADIPICAEGETWDGTECHVTTLIDMKSHEDDLLKDACKKHPEACKKIVANHPCDASPGCAPFVNLACNSLVQMKSDDTMLLQLTKVYSHQDGSEHSEVTEHQMTL